MQKYDRWDWRGSWASTGSNQGGWLSFLGKHVDLSCSHCMDIFMWKVIFNTMWIFVGFWIFLVVCRRKLGTTTLSIQSSILPNCLSWKIDQPWALGWPILSHVFLVGSITFQALRKEVIQLKVELETTEAKISPGAIRKYGETTWGWFWSIISMVILGIFGMVHGNLPPEEIDPNLADVLHGKMNGT